MPLLVIKGTPSNTFQKARVEVLGACVTGQTSLSTTEYQASMLYLVLIKKTMRSIETALSRVIMDRAPIQQSETQKNDSNDETFDL
jgi:hypothetical protein